MSAEVRVDPLTGLRVLLGADGVPALTPDAADPPATARPDLFSAVAARGRHELIRHEAPHDSTLAALSPDDLVATLGVWRERMRAHADAAYVHVSVDDQGVTGHGAELFALDFVPALVARERERFGAYAARTMGANLLADLVQEEVRARERIVAIDDEAVLMVPFAARAPYALMLVPRRPQASFAADGPTGAALLHDGLRRLRGLSGDTPSVNLWVRTAPRGTESFCWHVDVLPVWDGRLDRLALGLGVERNHVAPEQAAAELREV